VTVDLALGFASGGGGADVLSTDFETVIGSDFNDTLTGNSAANTPKAAATTRASPRDDTVRALTARTRPQGNDPPRGDGVTTSAARRQRRPRGQGQHDIRVIRATTRCPAARATDTRKCATGSTWTGCEI
jgi:hypothetical protein